MLFYTCFDHIHVVHWEYQDKIAHALQIGILESKSTCKAFVCYLWIVIVLKMSEQCEYA
jgi:hypothetical protein